MTTAQKHEYKTSGYNTPWDPTLSITAYFTHLDCFQISLGNRSIATSNEEKTMAAGAQMWQSKMFTEDQMVPWENKALANQTQAYFTKKWLKRKQYLATTAKKEAVLLAQGQRLQRRKEESKPCFLHCNKNNTTSKWRQWPPPTNPTWTPCWNK